MVLRDKFIWIISPQEWEHISISKHYYALELSNRNNKVFFINPPVFSSKKNFESLDIISENLQILTFHFYFPIWIKFKIKILFNYLLIKRFSKCIKKYGMPNILWNFDNGTYFKYEHLFNSYKIFHPVDSLNANCIRKHIKNYDIVFSVSNEILNDFNYSKKYLINHGLNSEFEILARERLDCLKKSEINLNFKTNIIGYVGNISIPTLDYKSLLNIIFIFPNIQFYFYGPYDEKDEKVCELKKFQNVKLKGVKYGRELYSSIVNCDLLFVCYKISENFKGDNSHKILEYLSTGKSIVSSHISMYQGNSLIEMCNSRENNNFEIVFDNALQNLDKLNSNEMQIKRIEFALENTYKKQIEKIESII